jgi:hypothetical protein
MKKHRLKITGDKIDTGGGVGRYSFRVSPLVADSPIFQFHRYIIFEEIGKIADVQGHVVNEDTMKARRVLARDLRDKHRKTWERYHMWADET